MATKFMSDTLQRDASPCLAAARGVFRLSDRRRLDASICSLGIIGRTGKDIQQFLLIAAGFASWAT
jgi:hypothetical protein